MHRPMQRPPTPARLPLDTIGQTSYLAICAIDSARDGIQTSQRWRRLPPIFHQCRLHKRMPISVPAAHSPFLIHGVTGTVPVVLLSSCLLLLFLLRSAVKVLHQGRQALGLGRQALPDISLPGPPGPVALRPAGRVHAAVHVILAHDVLQQHQRGAAHAGHGGLDEHPVDAGAVGPNIPSAQVFGQVGLRLVAGRVTVPAHRSLVVVGAGVAE
mmetsp:Transcript_14947/g.41991  ORF Transcript_14947/g.41991 Transcript_14947/m.41991 type:complete len:213 (-) Transcript_14947:1591-2229(-)